MIRVIPILSAFSETFVEISTDDALVEIGPANILHAIQGVLMRVILDEAEAAGSLLEPIQAHDETLNLSASVSMLIESLVREFRPRCALRKQLMDLFFCGVKGPDRVR
jgi:hypothetical protein